MLYASCSVSRAEANATGVIGGLAMPSPNEIAILRAVRAMGEPSVRTIGSKMEISSEYAYYMCSCLSKGGYLEKHPGRRYSLTIKGAVLLRDILLQIERKLNARIQRSHWMNIRMSESIDEITDHIKDELGERYEG